MLNPLNWGGTLMTVIPPPWAAASIPAPLVRIRRVRSTIAGTERDLANAACILAPRSLVIIRSFAAVGVDGCPPSGLRPLPGVVTALCLCGRRDSLSCVSTMAILTEPDDYEDEGRERRPDDPQNRDHRRRRVQRPVRHDEARRERLRVARAEEVQREDDCPSCRVRWFNLEGDRELLGCRRMYGGGQRETLAVRENSRETTAA